MTRLTNYYREQIVTKAVAGKFDPIRKELDDAENDLAQIVYETAYPLNVRHLIAKLPKGFCAERTKIVINASGWTVNLISKKPLRMSFDHGNGHRMLTCEAGTELCDLLRSHATAVKSYDEERKIAHNTIVKQFEPITTFERLREIWPEGKSYIDAVQPEPTQLPTVQIDAVNKMLDLSK